MWVLALQNWSLRDSTWCCCHTCRYYEAGGQLEVATLGNYGRVSVSHNQDGPTSIISAAKGGKQAHNRQNRFLPASAADAGSSG